MPEKSLGPGEQTWLEVGSLIRNQVPDKKGRVLPASVTEGSYEIRDISHSQLGYLYEGKLITDKTFGHSTYGCAGCCSYGGVGYNGFYILPDPMNGFAPGYGQYDAWATNQCTAQDDPVDAYSYSSSNTSVATIDSTGHTSFLSPGSTNVTALAKLQSVNNCCCRPQTFQTQAPGNAAPTITGPNTVWWFKGQNPNASAYPTTIMLTSNAGSATTWSVTQPDAKVNLSGTSGASITVTPTGTYVSGNPGDISITATSTANNLPSKPQAITVRTPWKLSLSSKTTTCDPTYVYITDLKYDVLDQLLSLISSDIFWNETVGACQSVNSNWGSICITTQPGSTSPLLDSLGGPPLTSNPPPSPSPKCNLPPSGTTPYETVTQSIFVGSSTAGAGVFVQGDTLTYYLDQGNHTDILIPPAPPK